MGDGDFERLAKGWATLNDGGQPADHPPQAHRAAKGQVEAVTAVL